MAPGERHAEDQPGHQVDKEPPRQHQRAVRRQFADHDLQRTHGRGQQQLHRAVLPFPGHGQRGKQDGQQPYYYGGQSGHGEPAAVQLRVVQEAGLEREGLAQCLSRQPGLGGALYAGQVAYNGRALGVIAAVQHELGLYGSSAHYLFREFRLDEKRGGSPA